MAATTISRATINDDTGDGESGDVLNAAFFGAKFYDKVDALFTAETGITLNQAAGDNAILSLESSDVAHGMTSLAYTTSVYGDFRKSRGANGGLKISGYDDGEANSALLMQGNQGTTVTTTKSTSGFGVCRINATKKSGTTATSIGADGNILSIEDDGTVRVIVDADGDIHYDGSAPASYDEWDDLLLARAFDLHTSERGVIRTAWDEFVHYKRDDLIRAGIVSPHGMVNLTQHTRLLNGALWQLFTRFKGLEAQIADTRRLIVAGA